MSRRKRLAAGECYCEHCYQPMLAAAAVTMNRKTYHPIGCFAPALARWREEVDRRLLRHVGSFELSVSMESATPELAGRIGQLARDLSRGLKAGAK